MLNHALEFTRVLVISHAASASVHKTRSSNAVYSTKICERVRRYLRAVRSNQVPTDNSHNMDESGHSTSLVHPSNLMIKEVATVKLLQATCLPARHSKLMHVGIDHTEVPDFTLLLSLL